MNKLLQAIVADQQVYSDAPLWEEVKSYGKIKVDDKTVSISESQYGHSLKIDTGKGVCYIKLRSSAKTDKKEYTVADFAATRDGEYGVRAGVVKRMAY